MSSKMSLIAEYFKQEGEYDSSNRAAHSCRKCGKGFAYGFVKHMQEHLQECEALTTEEQADVASRLGNPSLAYRRTREDGGRPERWSAREIEKLRALEEAMPETRNQSALMAALFPTRTPTAVRLRLIRLKDEEIAAGKRVAKEKPRQNKVNENPNPNRNATRRSLRVAQATSQTKTNTTNAILASAPVSAQVSAAAAAAARLPVVAQKNPTPRICTPAMTDHYHSIREAMHTVFTTSKYTIIYKEDRYTDMALDDQVWTFDESAQVPDNERYWVLWELVEEYRTLSDAEKKAVAERMPHFGTQANCAANWHVAEE